KESVAKLEPRLQRFFLDRERGFQSTTYASTRNQIVWRLDYLMTNDVMRAMFESKRTRFDIGKEMDAGKVIVINNSLALLENDGAEFFGRFFIALILSAARQRSDRPRHQKRPCFVYIDECHD